MKASLLLVVVGAGSSAGAEWVSHHTRIQRDIIRPITTTAEQFSVTLRRDHFDTMSPSWKMVWHMCVPAGCMGVGSRCQRRMLATRAPLGSTSSFTLSAKDSRHDSDQR